MKHLIDGLLFIVFFVGGYYFYVVYQDYQNASNTVVIKMGDYKELAAITISRSIH